VEVGKGVYIKVFDESLMRKKVDVVICTKDRSHLLLDAVKQISSHVENIVVVESSGKPEWEVLASYPKELFNDLGLASKLHVHMTPNVKLGCARQVGLEKAVSDYVFFIDDDIILDKNCFVTMFKTLLSDPKIVAVSGRVVYGYASDKVLFKLYRSGNPPKRGGSGGLTVLDRKKVLELGGFNKDIHWGEDMELCERVWNNGFKWVRERNAVGYHRCSFKESLMRAKRNGEGFTVLWKYGTLSFFKSAMRLFARSFIMPIYYAISLFDPRVFVYYFLYCLMYLGAFLREMNRT